VIKVAATDLETSHFSTGQWYTNITQTQYPLHKLIPPILDNKCIARKLLVLLAISRHLKITGRSLGLDPRPPSLVFPTYIVEHKAKLIGFDTQVCNFRPTPKQANAPRAPHARQARGAQPKK
jgi:hypothetical protein